MIKQNYNSAFFHPRGVGKSHLKGSHISKKMIADFWEILQSLRSFENDNAGLRKLIGDFWETLRHFVPQE